MIDWFLGLLTPAQWEAWRGWLTTLGGLLALFVAVSTYFRNVKIKREEQARLVYSKLEEVELLEPGDTFALTSGDKPQTGRVIEGAEKFRNVSGRLTGRALQPLIRARVVIHNGSEELIGPARLNVINTGTGEIVDFFSVRTDAIDPDSDLVATVTWINPVHPDAPALGTTLIFRDASGEWWRRRQSEPVEHAPYDPANSGPLKAERDRIRALQTRRGVAPESLLKDPRVAIHVRLRRLWRRVRGRSPLP